MQNTDISLSLTANSLHNNAAEYLLVEVFRQLFKYARL